jgi:hypothetical protein
MPNFIVTPSKEDKCRYRKLLPEGDLLLGRMNTLGSAANHY